MNNEGDDKCFFLFIWIFQHRKTVIIFIMMCEFWYSLFFSYNWISIIFCYYHVIQAFKWSRQWIFYVTRFFLIEVTSIFSFLQCGEYYGGFSSVDKKFPCHCLVFEIASYDAPEFGCGETSLFAMLAIWAKPSYVANTAFICVC